jgi:hypothetical protein
MPRAMQFPDKIPVRVPYGSAGEIPATVGALVEDKAFIEFIEAWKRELRGSSREDKYLKWIMSGSDLISSDRMSVSALRQILRATLDATTAETKEIEHPVAAFELVSIVDGFSQVALTRLPKRAKRELDTELTAVSGSVIIFAYQAIRHHLGMPAPTENT